MRGHLKKFFNDEFYLADEFLLKNFSSPTHRKEWNMAVSRQFNTDFFYFAYYVEDRLTGICPVHKIRNKLNYRLISGPKEFYMPFGGWIFSEDIVFDKSILNLKYNESLEIFSLPLIKEFKAGYSQYNLLKIHKTAIIDLEKSEDELWNSLPTQRRNKIRKAKKSNIGIIGLEEAGIDRFYDFYVLTNKQYGLENLSKDYFLELLSDSKNISLDVLIAVCDSEINGAVVVISDKNYSIYWLGARLESAANTGYFDLLQWEAIKKAKSRGCRFYDLCYLEKDRLPKIYKFKTDYAGPEIDILNINYKSINYSIINKIQKIF